MACKCKVIQFPVSIKEIHDFSDLKQNEKRHSRALTRAIERIAGHAALKEISPLIINLRVACDLKGYAEGIGYMEVRTGRSVVHVR